MSGIGKHLKTLTRFIDREVEGRLGDFLSSSFQGLVLTPLACYSIPTLEKLHRVSSWLSHVATSKSTTGKNDTSLHAIAVVTAKMHE